MTPYWALMFLASYSPMMPAQAHKQQQYSVDQPQQASTKKHKWELSVAGIQGLQEGDGLPMVRTAK